MSARQLEVLSRSATRLLEGHPLCAPDGLALLEEVVAALDAACCLLYSRGPSGALMLGAQLGVATTLEADAGVVWVSGLTAQRTPHQCGRTERADEPDASFLDGISVDAFLCCPLFGVDGALLGALTFGRATARPFDEEDRAFAVGIAAHAALGIEREAMDHALHESARRLSVLSDQIAGHEREADRLRREASENMADAQRLGQVGSWAIHLDERGHPIEPHYWSDQYFRLFGYEPGEVVPSLSLVYAHCHEDDRRLLPTAMPDGSDVLEHEFRVVQQGGDVRYMSSKTHQLRHPETGAPLRLVGTTQDVTERVLAKQALRQLNAELELRVEERTAELSAAIRELEAFAYAVSHDLRAPLRAMSGFSQALIEDHGEVLADEGKAFLGHIIDGSKRMADLIDGLLHLSRVGRGQLARERIDVSALAKEVFDELIRAEAGRNVQLEIAPNLRARGDGRMLRAVVQNLLSNAIKYTEARDPALVRVYEEVRFGQRCVVVSDNGAGFDMAHHGKLFRPFSRLHRESEFAGLGLGLATVERVVRRHGGGVFAEGILGEGARFGFWLPTASGGHSEVA